MNWPQRANAREDLDPALAEKLDRDTIRKQPADSFDARVHLAFLMIRDGRISQAELILREAREWWPESFELKSLLGLAAWLSGDNALAIQYLEDLPDPRESFEAVWDLRGRCLIGCERFDAAERHYQRWLEIEPNHPIAQHMLAAIQQADIPQRASPDYIRHAFNPIAPVYDTLASHQHYRAPEFFTKLLQDRLADFSAKSRIVLDAGCGTGLLGRVLREYAQKLDGVDLCAAMLERAKQKQVYDQLECADLTLFMESCPQRYDVIAAAEVFPYFGDLSKLIPSCLQALTPHGWLVFSVEQGGLSDEFSLQPNGRYCHSPHYLVWLLGQAGITDGTMHKVAIRKENEQDVPALLIALQKPFPKPLLD